MYYEATPLMVPTVSMVQEEVKNEESSFTDQVFGLLASPFQLSTILLVVFYVLNIAFAIIAAATLIAGTAIGVGLLPLCCLGVLVLQGLLYVMQSLAKFDISLYNCIAPRGDRILDTFHMPRQGAFHFSGYRLSPAVVELFSQESFLAIFYFILVKLPMSVISSVSSLALLTFCGFCFAFPFQYDFYVAHKDLLSLEFKHGRFQIHEYNHDFPLRLDDWPQVVLFGVLVLYLTCVWMHVCAQGLRATTKAFMCESFTASGMVYSNNSNGLGAPSAPTLYGAAPAPSSLQHNSSYYQKI
ncbi:hypothetical protein THRCLA_09353 [Thraustotheca clavata]|uniref:Putative sensor domain-containing protein n=1 Tax=Thraustotheca clavata TaxID=74557 RepID=A0A1V9YXN0_9STRA|nr:hypothetical protein THRCLA_09353 [Thraustotheca clavata]